MKTMHLLTTTLCLLSALPAFAGKSQQLSSPDQVPEGLQKSDWQSIHAAHEAWQHEFRQADGQWRANNPGQRWTTTFDGRGFLAQPKEANWTWGLELKSYGFDSNPRNVTGTPKIKAAGQRLTYHWQGGLEEWFVNDERGLEHGFSVAERPEGARDDEPLVFTLATVGELRPSLASDGQTVHFRDAGGAPVLNYSGLKVWDASGTILKSWFKRGNDGQFRIAVVEANARYPITIDPIAQQAYIKASNTGVDDRFGSSVAVSGDTVVVGAFRESSGTTGVNSIPNDSSFWAGAAYVFVRNGGVWSQQAYLKASNTGSGDFFGTSVAVSGDTVVVGANNEDSSTTGVNSTPNESASSAGAAYVFLRSAGVWSQQAYLKAANTEDGDRFGISVAVSGDTVVVGAINEDSSTTGVNSAPNENAAGSGAAYVFVRSGSVWGQEAYLKASNTGAGDWFGNSVAASGDTVVVGAYLEDSDTTGVNSMSNESATDSGAAYVFVRSSTVWSQQAYLKAFNTGADDLFGYSVAASGDTMVVGALQEDSGTTGVNSTSNESATDSGAAYVFVRSSTVWSQQAYLKASNTGSGDLFGRSVAVSVDTVVVGADLEDSGTTGVNSVPNESATNSGAAYVFLRSGGTVWSQQAYLKPANTGSSDFFGGSVAASEATVVIGALQEDSGTTGVNSTPNEGTTDSGAAYIFTDIVGPNLALEAPSGTAVFSGTGTLNFGLTLLGETIDKTLTIRNTGGMSLTGIAASITGTDALHFSVITAPPTDLAASASAAFTVRFSPGASGTKTATLSIASNDPDENPFTITLTGRALSVTEDTDGDGLNDAAEFKLTALGYDWQVAQPALVNTLFANSNLAGLYSQSQVQALNVGTPLISRNTTTGKFTLKMDWKKSVDLQHFTDFPAQTSGVSVDPFGDILFEFTSPDNAAFFRLEAK